MEDSSNSNVGCNGGEIVSVTPTKKQELLKFELQSLNTDLSPTSDGDNSSVSSMNEGCESPLSSWESEPETDIPSLINCDGMPDQRSLQSINLEENYLDMEEQNQFVGVENTGDGLLWEMDNKSYEELLKKFIEKEEELRFSNFRLELLEQENINLKVQVENSETQLDNVSKELKLKEEELHKQIELSEEEISKLKIQNDKSENRRKELKLKEEELNKQKELSEEEIFKLKIQIEKSEIKAEDLHQKQEEMKKQIAELNTYIPEFDHKLTNFVEQLEVALENLKISKGEIAILRMELASKSSETNQLQGQLKVTQENMAKSELELVSERQQNQMLRDLVKIYEEHKQRMDMVMIELGEANDMMIANLKAEICLRDDKISNIKKHTNDVKTSLKELMVDYNNAQKEVYKLKLRVAELENKVTGPNRMIFRRG